MTIYDADVDAAVWRAFKALPRWFQIVALAMLGTWTMLVVYLFGWALTR